MEDSTPIPDSQDVSGMAASLMQNSGSAATQPQYQYQPHMREFPVVPPSVPYPHGQFHPHLYGIPRPQPHYGHYASGHCPENPYLAGHRADIPQFVSSPGPQSFIPTPSRGHYTATEFDSTGPNGSGQAASQEPDFSQQQNTTRPPGRPPRRKSKSTGHATSSRHRRNTDVNRSSQPVQTEAVDGNRPSPESETGEDESDVTGGRVRWEDWQVHHLLEAKRAEYEELDQSGSRDMMVNATVKWRKIRDKLVALGVRTTAKRCKAKWDVLIRDYRKIKDFENKTGNPPYQSLSAEEKRDENVPPSFDSEWIDLLDSFMASRPSTVPPSVADSSGVMGGDSAVDDATEPSSMEHRLNGKRKRNVGENTKFLANSITGGMRESMQMLTTVMRECEKESNEMMSGNVDKLCDVLRFLASAVVRME